MLFALEHRYYGPSVPVPDLTLPNMRVLSSEQALQDLANFVTGNPSARSAKHQCVYSSGMNEKHNLGGSKWVTFGGSYPGMMSSFARLKFPHLIHASVASSAPVQAQVIS